MFRRRSATCVSVLRKYFLLKKLARWQRTFNTIRHLQPRQAWYFFLRRGIGARRVTPSVNALTLRDIVIHPVLQFAHGEDGFSNYEFNFLNRTLSFPRSAMNWCPLEAQRLWRYNLHYFDFLRDSSRPLQQKTALIDDWIVKNPQGSEPAWEPYTASLRIVNWCLFFWSLPQEQVTEQWRNSLHTQAHWLEHNLELHILANHYFENIKALLFAALFFQDANSTRWLNFFQKELIAQLAEQTLSDGGHYERSPQYHCILLEDYLDIYGLLLANKEIVKVDTLTTLEKTITGGLRFLAAIATPDDDIPLFNDSASGSASRPSAIFAKAEQLGFIIETPGTALIDFPESGLFGWKSGGDYFLIDCGDIGPAYQPGHTHCDFLSFVLMIDGQWLVVDSGVCEYEPGEMRSYVRSTAAHNTAIVDDNEQSEIWSEFRVGRRAQRIDAALHRDGNKIIFEGAYRGFPTLDANIIHRRYAVLTLTEAGNIIQLDINDSISGGDNVAHRIETLLHLHPALTCSISNENELLIEIRRDTKYVASVTGLSLASSRESWHCPQFGLAQTNQTLQTTVKAQLPATLSYRIKVID